jgi:hypothetical protein
MLREDYIIPAANGKILATLRCCFISEEDPPSILPSYVVKIKKGDVTHGKIYNSETGELLPLLRDPVIKHLFKILFFMTFISFFVLEFYPHFKK